MKWRLTPAALVVLGLSSNNLGHRTPGAPKCILWAWEQPENLISIDQEKVGVAFLAMTLRLRGDDILVIPRQQPLIVPELATRIAVVRIESGSRKKNWLSNHQLSVAADEISSIAKGTHVQAVQIDFDATIAERGFYRELIKTVREQLPKSVSLSITALVSWCMGDDWLSGLPINEAVPMLFRMGPDGRQILFHLEAGRDFREPLCRSSFGISTDEPIRKLPAGRRIYIFHPKPWSPEAVRDVLQRSRAWQ